MFRNIWLKTPYVNKLPVPLLQRLLGLILDSYHDNFQELLEIWLENVNITEIRNTDRNNEKKQRNLCINHSWQSERRKKIHSYNFVWICKCTERTDKDKLACHLTKNVPNQCPIHTSWQMLRVSSHKRCWRKMWHKDPKLWHICVKVPSISCCLTKCYNWF